MHTEYESKSLSTLVTCERNAHGSSVSFRFIFIVPLFTFFALFSRKFWPLPNEGVTENYSKKSFHDRDRVQRANFDQIIGRFAKQ